MGKGSLIPIAIHLLPDGNNFKKIFKPIPIYYPNLPPVLALEPHFLSFDSRSRLFISRLPNTCPTHQKEELMKKNK